VRLLRTLSTRSLLILVAAVLVLAVGGTAIGLAASGDRHQAPPPKPLASAVHDALVAPAPAGITARVTFTNNLLPSGGLFGSAGSALLSGASGRLWLTNDGRGRIELQSDAGDVQVVWSKTHVSVYDASSNTVYELALPAQRSGTAPKTKTPPTLAEITNALTQLGQNVGLSGAIPTDVAGQPAYRVTVSPKTTGSLLGSAQLAWDAQHGVPLRIAVYAKGGSAPALALSATSISFGSVPSSVVDVAPPAGAKVVTLSGPGGGGAQPKPVTGLPAVRAAAGFTVVAPDTVAGRSLSGARLVGGKHVLLVYGDGPDALLVVERSADAAAAGGGFSKMLPPVALGAVTGHELTTALGTVVLWDNGGVSFVVAGSVPASTAEAAARALAGA
jgi:outer membrane lipoprotein-sorting protein